jgi:hypothetical protein
VDDNPFNIYALESLLNEENINDIEKANNGEEAI